MKLISPCPGALDQQKEMYEQKLEELRREKTPDTLMSGRTSSGYVSEDRILNSTPTSFYDRYTSHFNPVSISCLVPPPGSQYMTGILVEWIAHLIYDIYCTIVLDF